MILLKCALLFVVFLGINDDVWCCSEVLVHNITELNAALSIASITEITLAAPSYYNIATTIDFGNRVITGQDPNTVVITCTGSLATGVYIRGGGKVAGVTVQNCTYSGIAATNASIENCIVKYNGVQGITVDNGAVINGSWIIYNGNTGGGVHVNSGQLTIQNSNISYNTGSNGGGVYSSGTVFMLNSTVSHNTATSLGGGIFINGGSSKIATSVITRNTAGNEGGGIYASNFLSLLDSVVSYNSVPNNCGGLSCRDHYLRNVSVVGNSAVFNGGGVCVYSSTSDIRNSSFESNTAGSGGGLWSSPGVTIANSSFSYNTASGYDGGGGLLLSQGYLVNVIFAYNSAVNTNGGGMSGGRAVTLTGCSFVGNEVIGGAFGGGMYLNEATVLLDQCSFVGNIANQGGGVYTDDTQFNISNSNFNSNIATGGDGGGASLRMNPIGSVKNVTFSSNNAQRRGGGLRTTGNVNISGCSFVHNTAAQGGGLAHEKDMWSAYANNFAVISNCVFNTNSAQYGGGMVVADAPATIAANNIIA